MAFYKVDGKTEELAAGSWFSLSYACQGEKLLIQVHIGLLTFSFFFLKDCLEILNEFKNLALKKIKCAIDDHGVKKRDYSETNLTVYLISTLVMY